MSTASPDYDRESVILLVREWFDVHGEPPRAWEWNPTEIEKRSPDVARAARRAYAESGAPGMGTVRRLFSSWTSLLITAGFYPRQSTSEWAGTPLPGRAYYLRDAVEALKTKNPELA